MADPKTKNGHIDIANTVADKFCSYRLNGQEWQIIWVVLRKTWGWLEDLKNKDGPKKKMDRIALSQFSQLTGINRSRCHAILKGLIKKQIIKRTVTQKCNIQQISYGIQSDYDKWRVLPKNATVTQKCNGVLPKSATTKDTITKDTITKEKEHTAFDNAEQKKEDFYLTKKKKKLSEKRLETFEQFWNAFDYKRGKAEAADAWLDIPELTNAIVDKIIEAATIESQNRPNLIAKGSTPKMAQGWLSGRRWEDENINQKLKDDRFDFLKPKEITTENLNELSRNPERI